MRTTILLGAIALLTAAPVLATGADTLTVAAGSRIWVEGTSSIRSFSCDAPEFNLVINAPEGAAAQVLAGAKAVKTLVLTVPAVGIDCRNGTMDNHMRKALKAEANPNITFALTTYEISAGNVVMNGTLTMGGAARPVNITADVAPGEGGTIKVTGTHTVKLSEFGLKAPSLMLGTMKVGDTLKVGFDLNLR